MSIITPDTKSQEAMQAKTQAIPPKVREEVSPLPSGGTEGQVLTMGETEPDWEDVPKELPETLGTAGQVLTVNSGATGVEWASPAATDQYILEFAVDALPEVSEKYKSYTALDMYKLYKNGVQLTSEEAESIWDTIPEGTVIYTVLRKKVAIIYSPEASGMVIVGKNGDSTGGIYASGATISILVSGAAKIYHIGNISLTHLAQKPLTICLNDYSEENE